MLKRGLKLMVFLLAPAVLVASFTSLSAMKESRSSVNAEQAAQSGLSREAELRRLDELQKQLGVYRPWPKSGN